MSRFIYLYQDSYIYVKIHIYMSRFIYIYVKIHICMARFIYVCQDSYIYVKIHTGCIKKKVIELQRAIIRESLGV